MGASRPRRRCRRRRAAGLSAILVEARLGGQLLAISCPGCIGQSEKRAGRNLGARSYGRPPRRSHLGRCMQARPGPRCLQRFPDSGDLRECIIASYLEIEELGLFAVAQEFHSEFGFRAPCRQVRFSSISVFELCNALELKCLDRLLRQTRAHREARLHEWLAAFVCIQDAPHPRRN